MASRGFLLKRERRELADLLGQLDRVLVGLECGLELGYVWRQASGESGGGSFIERLQKYAQDHPVSMARPWFRGLVGLYREGAPLLPYFQAFGDALRDQLRQQMEKHDRELPFRLNIVLLIFSLPPVFVLLFGAILRAFTKAWAG